MYSCTCTYCCPLLPSNIQIQEVENKNEVKRKPELSMKTLDEEDDVDLLLEPKQGGTEKNNTEIIKETMGNIHTLINS